jgi:flagellar biosynthesis protein FliR
MPAELPLSLSTLCGFLLVLARVSGVFALVPLPGMPSGPKLARVTLSVVITLALFPLWPAPDASRLNAGRLVIWVLPEVAVGVVIGLAVSFVLEVLIFCAQILSLNAGFSFAATIDPATQAESPVLLVLAQLAGGLVFFAMGLDREVIRILAFSLTAHPAGSGLTLGAGEALIRLGGDMLAVGTRLALPALALLVLTDLALALLGRLNAQLQLLTLAFPIKMLGALALLAWILVLLPRLLGPYAGEAFGTLHRVLRF